MSSVFIDARSYSEKLNEFYRDIKCFEDTLESDINFINKIDDKNIFSIYFDRIKIDQYFGPLDPIPTEHAAVDYKVKKDYIINGLNEVYKKITNALIPLKDKQDHYNNIYKLIYGSVRAEYEKIMYTDLYNELKIAYMKYNNIKKDYEYVIKTCIICVLRIYGCCHSNDRTIK